VDVDGIPWVAHQDGIERIDPDASASAGVVASGAASTDIAFGAGRVWVVTEPSPAEHAGGTLRLISDPLNSLDPARASGPDTWRVLDALNDGLVAYGGPDGRSLVANLAVRIPAPSADGMTYAFRLREGVRYSTGEQLAPEDVRHSFERVLGHGEPVASFLPAIVGARSCLEKQGRCDLSEGIVTSENSRTVTFHLTRPDPEFMAKLATPPASVLPVTVPMDIQVTVPGTGPYDVVEYDAEKQVVLERRDDFEPWAPAAQSGGYAERIVVQMNYPGQASRAVLAGHADWTDVSGADVSALRRRHGSHIREFPRPAIFAVFLNTKVPPFDDVDVRRALNLAVDREVVQQTFGGSQQATITCQILPPGSQGFDPYCPYTAEPGPSGQWHAPDLQRAKRLLRGKERVPVVVWGFNDVADTAEHIAAVLRDLGYPAEHRTLPLERFFSKVMTEPDVQAGVYGWFGDLPGAFSFIAANFGCAVAHSSEAANYAHHCDPAIDRLGRKAARLQFSDPQRANDLWAHIDRRLTRTAAWVPLVNPKGVELVSDRLGNYRNNPVTGIVLSEAWVK
jgi:peptide/nickel transport system substrate-binding protein